MNSTSGEFNETGLVENMQEKAGSFYVGYPISWEWLTTNIQKGQDYLLQNTTLGIPALVQTEGIHGFLIGNATIFNSPIGYDGIPAVADYHTLTEILRDEWAFKLCQSSPIDSEAITLAALPAGNDVEMGGGSFNFKEIPELVKSGKLDIKTVDTAVSRLLRAKFEMGLFENPYPGVPSSQWSKLIHTPEALSIARDLDRESIVLLENHNNILPLKKDGNIAVIGPMAHGFMNYGDYVVYQSQYRGVTPLDGIKNAVGNSATINYAQGCERWSNDQSGFDEAIEAAKKSDVAVVVVGTWSRDQEELWEGLNATTGEHVDVNDLRLVGAQAPLVKAIIDTGIPTIVVFSSGKPVTEPWISNSTAALIQQFYPSEQGGNALADVLFGDYNPSGKLSVSFPRSVGALPIFYDYLNSGRSIGDSGFVTANDTLVFGHQYVIGSPLPWYEFGYGKSYSTFKYGAVQLDKTNVTATDTVTVSIDIKNEDTTRNATEVVQVYITDEYASVVVPNQQLKGFDKVVFGPGETQTVSIQIHVGDLGLWNVNMKYVVEPGAFSVHVGSSSVDIRGNATFYVA
ncbi:hypothetical protein PISL3812_04158 [Talaromyces islandicus]|uniref:beta-glucosidase n=1 Tax=Talaromyces islandicus TaxID=28573 RepID=A0A0U1LUQ9_TALIS|nr:hypothetical protein PISL3812_04158 [Talaromyces islandicus]